MFACSNRDKVGDAQITELQTIVAQLRIESQRSSQSIGELQQALQKTNLRLAEVEVALQDSKQHLAAVEAALHKSNQKSRSLEVAVEEAVRRSKSNGYANNNNGYVSNIETPRHDTISDISEQTPRPQDPKMLVEQRWKDNSSQENPSLYGSPLNSIAGSKVVLQAPSVQSSEFVGSRPIGERLSSVELLITNLWQFHVASMWIPAPPRNPADETQVKIGSSASDLLKIISTLAGELGSRIDHVEHGLFAVKCEVERRTGPIRLDYFDKQGQGGWGRNLPTLAGRHPEQNMVDGGTTCV
jgi:hypothetical protein